KVNTYYEENAKWAKKILRLDPLGIHKVIPATWLIKPYNMLTTLMRKDLKEQNDSTLEIKTSDFYLTTERLDFTWDIFVVAKK
ncbi:MAG: hypothetical protein KBB37_12870, partial [Bacteroidia bacterium]|nr:hypothetical protein [Bacteroidia bacterium]MBP7262169.1 hypothetical protein [Bacteroidia bacterium]MBP9181306.1 hypothetical protein [Bacteroidia bacterium]